MENKTKIAVAYGDGIGPEIMEATLKILDAAGAAIEPEVISIGEKEYLAGNTSGINPDAWEVIRRNKIILKAPITTPQGGGYKSLNVTIRKSLGLYANVRPCRSLAPFVKTHHPEMDVVVVRENEEDLYAGIEHRQTAEVYQCLKLITRPGSERIIRYAFEYAVANNRRKVTCMVKDNIMKITDGLFHQVFKEVGKEYPNIEQDVQIIDIGAAKLSTEPGTYDVIVTSNLYGDIISDITAQISGSVGMAGSANIGTDFAMFEAIHGSAPDITGKGIANPTGLLNGAIMMLVHIGDAEVAEKIGNAWLRTLEDGLHTADIFHGDLSKKKVTTSEFADAIIENLGKLPEKFEPLLFKDQPRIHIDHSYERPVQKKELVGIDVFVEWPGKRPEELGKRLEDLSDGIMKMKMITNRGVKVYPDGMDETFCTDHWRCRFVAKEVEVKPGELNYPSIHPKTTIDLLAKLTNACVEVIKTENLYAFDGERGFSLGQGE